MDVENECRKVKYRANRTRFVHPIVGLAAEIVGLGVKIDSVFLAGDLAGREIRRHPRPRSLAISTLYFAAAICDNGDGTVIGSELVPERVANARRNFAEAGIADFVDMRQGDARETLRDLGGPVDSGPAAEALRSRAR